jgi:S1-C subfamily serine protease
VREADVVVRIDGQPAASVDDIHRLLVGETIVKRITVDVIRDGALKALSMTVRERPRG